MYLIRNHPTIHSSNHPRGGSEKNKEKTNMKMTRFLAVAIGSLSIAAYAEGEFKELVAPQGTRHANAAVYTKDNLYRIGGHSSYDTALVNRFPLKDGQPDGRIISEKSFLDKALRSPGAAVVGDNIYVAGGSIQQKGQPDVCEGNVYKLPVNADGSLGEAQIVSTLPDKNTSNAGMISIGNKLYVVGGDKKRSCHMVEVKADGSLGEWQEFDKLPTNLGAAGKLAELKGILYVTGVPGHNMRSEKVYAAKLGENSLPGKWRRTSNLQVQANGVGALVADDDSLLYFDGENGIIYRAKLDNVGELGDWIEAGKMPGNLIGFTITRIPNGFFLMGGLVSIPPNNKYLGGILIKL
jgi:hypothetical protein